MPNEDLFGCLRWCMPQLALLMKNVNQLTSFHFQFTIKSVTRLLAEQGQL